MENALTLAEYIKLTAIVVGVSALIVTYWIKVIIAIGKSLDHHKVNDEKEFNESQRFNDAAHAELRQEIGRVKGGAENSITELRGDIKLMNGKLDTLIEITKNQLNK